MNWQDWCRGPVTNYRVRGIFIGLNNLVVSGSYAQYMYHVDSKVP